MGALNKYRFRLANLCDVAETFTATEVGQFGTTNIIIGAHGFQEGDYVYLEGFAGPLNGYRKIDVTGADYIGVIIAATIDTGILGTVKSINERLVSPLNFYESKFEWNQETDEIFFRKLFNSPLLFENADYDYFLENILENECCEVKFFIEKMCGDDNAWRIEWQGYFTHNSCIWNLSHCQVEVYFELDDYYRCLLYGIDDKQTIFDTLQYFERLECCAERALTTAPGGSCSPPCTMIFDALFDSGDGEVSFNGQHTVDPCDDSDRADWQIEKVVEEQITFTGLTFEYFKNCYTWIREVAITMDVDGNAVTPSGSGWVLRTSVNYNGLPAHKWTRIPYDGAYNSFSDYTHSHSCGAEPCTHTFQVNFPDTPDSTTTQKGLLDVISVLASNACGAIQGVRSDFFELNAPGDTPGFVSGTNYVTGAASQITNIRLQQISAFTTVSDAVEDIMSDLTLNELLQALKTLFNCKWFVDEDGFLRIEHISWFQRTAGVDTTVGYYNQRANKAKKSFRYDRADIPVREVFTCVYQGYLDFIGKDIKYNSACVNLRKTVTHAVQKFSTDLKHIQDHADEFKDFNSFLLLACDADDVVLTEEGILSGEDQLNGHLSWANLHENYHRYDRYLISGTMNDEDTTFETAKKIKRQVPVVYKGENGCCDVIDPLIDLVTTELGDGQIDKMTKDNRDEIFTIELLY